MAQFTLPSDEQNSLRRYQPDQVQWVSSQPQAAPQFRRQKKYFLMKQQLFGLNIFRCFFQAIIFENRFCCFHEKYRPQNA